MPDDPVVSVRVETNKSRMGYYFDSAIERQKAMTAMVVITLQSMLITNGGALAGMLTFVGNVPDVASRPGLICSFVCFAIGLTVALLTGVFAYVTNAQYFQASRQHAESLFWVMNAEQQRAEESARDADRENAIGGKFEVVALILAGFSIAAFLPGALTGISALVG